MKQSCISSARKPKRWASASCWTACSPMWAATACTSTVAARTARRWARTATRIPRTGSGSPSRTGRTITTAGGASARCPTSTRWTRTSVSTSWVARMPSSSTGCVRAPAAGGWMWRTSCRWNSCASCAGRSSPSTRTRRCWARSGRTRATRSPTARCAPMCWATRWTA